MSELFDLCRKYDCVKTRDKYVYSWDYANIVYPRYLDPIRNQPITILEIGIHRGGFLRALRDYCPRATIIGLDYDLAMWNDEIKENGPNNDRIIVYQGDQADTAKLKDIAKLHGPFHFIIDDACHRFQPQLTSLETLWPHLQGGGYYFIEDVFKTRGSDAQMFEYVQDTFLTRRNFCVKFEEKLCDKESITFHNSIICIEKRLK